MAIQDFQQQSQNAMQSGLRLGGALQNAQSLQQQRALNEQLNPLRVEQAQLQNQGLRTQAAQREQLNPLIMQQQQLQNEGIQRDNLRKELTQDAVMLASYDEETGKKVIPQLIEKYKDNPQVVEGFNKLYSKTGKDYISANIQALSMLTGKPIGGKPKSTGKVAELEAAGFEQGTPEFQDAMKSLIFKDTEGKTSLKASDIKGINADISKLTSEYKGVYNAAKDLEKLGKLKSAPAQMAMIFKYMKSLDPASTVRESEYASAQNTTGIPERLMNYYNKAVDGSLLNDVQIKEFVNVAKELSNSRAENVEANVADYLAPYGNIIDEDRKKAFQNRAGVKVFDISSPTLAAPEVQAPAAAAQAFANAPAVGSEQGGYRYNGGDPALESSWTKI